jgi:hypothetical protein
MQVQLPGRINRDVHRMRLLCMMDFAMACALAQLDGKGLVSGEKSEAPNVTAKPQVWRGPGGWGLVYLGQHAIATAQPNTR